MNKIADFEKAVISDPFFGIVAIPFNWVPSLRYSLRRARLLKLFKAFAADELLEIGCAGGALLIELSAMNYRCQGLETSEQARQLAARLFKACGTNIPLHQAVSANWQNQFQYVSAFDVLEHIEDDVEALQQWRQWIKPQGKLILSVPAHRSRWGPGDVWAGHYRRYDAADLKLLLTQQGFCIEHFECYGFPLANLSEWVGKRSYQRLLDQQQRRDKEAASAESGIERNSYLSLFRWMNTMLGRFLLYSAMLLQTCFSRTNFGSGYIVVASKK